MKLTTKQAWWRKRFVVEGRVAALIGNINDLLLSKNKPLTSEERSLLIQARAYLSSLYERRKEAREITKKGVIS